MNENYIQVNKCQTYTIDNQNITLCLDSITQDSRCPIDVVCIWQGLAVARFNLKAQNKDHLITLATMKFAPYSRDTTIAGFKIEFIGLTPQTDTRKPFNYRDYIAEVKISKL